MRALLLDERPLQVLPSLVKLVGMERAIVLQQIHWLLQLPNSGVNHDGHHWVYGTYDEWCNEYFPFWKPRTLRSHISRLEADGFIVSAQINKADWDRRKHYRIDYDALYAAMRQDDVSSMCHDHDTSMRQHRDSSMRQEGDTSMWQDDVSSMRHNDDGSDWHDHDASKRQEVDSSYIEQETTTKTTTKTSTEEWISGAGAPLPAPNADTEAFAVCLCWVCHGHRELSNLTVRSAGQIRSEAARLVADGYTSSDLRRWYEEHWKQDWRYRKNRERPNPYQVREMIPILRDAANANPYAALDGLVVPTAPRRLPSSKSRDPVPTDLDDGDIRFTDGDPQPTGSEPWARILHNYCLADQLGHGSGLSEHLVGSHLEAAGDVDGIPYYVIHAANATAAHWIKRSIRNLRMDLGIELGLRKVLLTVAQPEDTPTEPTTDVEAVT